MRLEDEAKEVFSLKPQTSNLKHFYDEQHFLPLPWRESPLFSPLP